MAETDGETRRSAAGPTPETSLRAGPPASYASGARAADPRRDTYCGCRGNAGKGREPHKDALRLGHKDTTVGTRPPRSSPQSRHAEGQSRIPAKGHRPPVWKHLVRDHVTETDITDHSLTARLQSGIPDWGQKGENKYNFL